jgi:regulator of PEP synthase PpsR (kinase-PPPase family)
MSPRNRLNKDGPPTIYVVSGGVGSSGRQIAESTLAQFATTRMPIVVRKNVRDVEQLEAVVLAASTGGGTVLHTLVDSRLRSAMIRLGRQHKVSTIDLMGPLLRQVSRITGEKPLGEPGRYRNRRKEYFDRADAIDFTMSHDDGARVEDLAEADIVIAGLSRCGKTPLSMYLAVHGWKVANVPIVNGIPVPPEIFQLEDRRVIGLLIDFNRLLGNRKQRDKRMGRLGVSSYSDPSAVFEEIEAARKIYRKGRFHVIDVTDKPIEITADEVINYVTDGRGRLLKRSVPT